MIHNQYFSEFENFIEYLKQINYSYLNIISVNVRSISSIEKFNQFKTLISNFPQLPNIIAIQETWFHSTLSSIYNIPGYNSIHCCRADGFGGTSVYVKNNLQYTVQVCENKSFCDLIVLTLENFKINGKPLKIVSFYRSPKCNVNDFYNIVENLMELYGRNYCIFVGDSNIDFLNEVSNTLLNLLESYDFKNCHTLITRPISATSIDNAFTNLSHSIFIDAIECEFSDHNMISCKVKKKIQNCDYTEFVQKKCDYNKLKECFLNYSSNFLSGNSSIDASSLIKCLSDANKNSTSELTRKKLLKEQIAPWINENLRNLFILKRRILKQRRRNPNDANVLNSLKRISKVIKVAYKESMNRYYHDNLHSIQQDPKKCWRFLNESLGRSVKTKVNLKNSNGELIMEDAIKCELLNKYFLQIPKTMKEQIDYSPADSCNGLRTLRNCNKTFNFRSTTNEEISEIINNLTNNKSPGHDNLSPRIFINLNNEITPLLLHIFNNVILTAQYPNILKISKIVPIPKAVNAHKVDMYRPIALLPIMDKIFEKLIHQQFTTYLENNNLLYDCQFGFRKGSGTEDAVINVVNFICRGLDEGYNAVGGVFYDLSKAFDLVDHDIMLEKLQFYGVRGVELNLFKSYLNNRKQYVVLNNSKSSLGNVEHGVPQGSVLGPLLFTIYINDINNLELFGKLYMYADDISLFYPYKHEAVLKVYMERDAALISEYMRLNKLILNSSKTKVIRFKPYINTNAPKFSVFVDGEEIFETNAVKYLGVTLQSNLSWNLHIKDIKSKISPVIGLLYKFKYKFDEKTKLIIYEALIQSHLNYLVSIYAYKNSIELQSLQRTQNKALKNVYNLPIRYPTLRLYQEIAKNILPINGIYKKQVLLFVFKSLHNIGHSTITFTRNQSTFATRSSSNLKIARCRLEKTKQRIEFIGCVEYNNLPQNLKDINVISSFKSNIKTYFLNNLEMLLM